jgi:NADH dehydrogenase (ubiquinone) flavoprotein 2
MGLRRSVQFSRAFSGHGISQHRPSEVNNPDTPFEFNEDSRKKITTILARYPSNYKQSAVMPLLTLAQEQNQNWLPLSAMNKVAEILDMPPIRVYEVATFYSMYNREPVGKYHIQLCGTTPCMLRGAEKIKRAVEKHVGIHEGETSKDGLFTLSEVECLGACVNAPMIQVNNHEFYENLTEETTVKLLDDWKAGRPPKVGPQNGQRNCEGPKGKTSLLNVPQPQCRDLDALKAAELSKAAAAAPAGGQPPAAGAKPAAAPNPAQPAAAKKS